MWDTLFDDHAETIEQQMQAIFSSIFVLQNRLQSAGDKLQTEISMKQWLLLAMTEVCPEPRTLTRIGALMGCSRQNVKKLAQALAQNAFVQLERGAGNAVEVVLTERAAQYIDATADQNAEALAMLFADLSEAEIAELFRLYRKLYAGMTRLEAYAREEEAR